MKLFKKFLHWWITLASMAGFLGGWALLSHAPKPVQPNQQQTAVATLEPLTPLPPLGSLSLGDDGGGSAAAPQFFAQRPTRTFRMRTGGS